MVVLMIMYLYLNKQGPQVFPNIYDKICSSSRLLINISNSDNFLYALQFKYLHKKSDKST